ncbi:MAG: DUF2726 domain-containing protein [Akkermansiaceae bacterium]|nr:DUF2726 domain-containing protein [Akkermansiaceae bacterium]
MHQILRLIAAGIALVSSGVRADSMPSADPAAIRRAAAAALSTHVRPSGETHLLQAADAAPTMWTELEGLRIGACAPLAVSKDDAESSVGARFAVAIDVSRHRSTHAKLRRWSAWRDGAPPELPTTLDVVLRNGAWEADATPLRSLKTIRTRPDPASIPRSDAPPLAEGALPSAASAGIAETQTPGSEPQVSGKPIVALIVFGVLAAAALVIGRMLANRGVIRSPHPVAAAGGSITAVRPRPHMLDRDERSFHQALEAAVRPGRVVSPKVRLADLFEAPADDGDAMTARLASTHADFVLTDAATSRILAVIQLVDRNNLSPAAARRHEFIRSLCHAHQVPHYEFPAHGDHREAVERSLKV